MKADDILQAGIDALKARAVIRDAPNGERSARVAADIMTAWTGRPWSESDIWMTLIAVKMARSVQGRLCLDDHIDGAAFFALLGEAQGGS